MATLWIVGMMGSGKSTVAPLVAAALGRDALDTDDEVERVSDRSIDDWFAADPAGFRQAEAAVVARAAGADVVVACGGGVVLDEDSVGLMRETGVIVWLEAPARVLASRVGDGEGRPLLGPHPLARLEDVATLRRGAYEAAAHSRVDASADVESVTAGVIEAWKSFS